MIILEQGNWTAQQLNDAERRWIKRYDNLTNQTPGGQGGGVKGRLYGSHDRGKIGLGFRDPDTWRRAYVTRWALKTPDERIQATQKIFGRDKKFFT